jgi:BMFP domain-containing protein YqiC
MKMTPMERAIKLIETLIAEKEEVNKKLMEQREEFWVSQEELLAARRKIRKLELRVDGLEDF